jgi:outer membrane protein W
MGNKMYRLMISSSFWILIAITGIRTNLVFSSEQLSTCAVLTFEAKEGARQDQATLLCNRFSDSLSGTGKYRVIPRQLVNNTLAGQVFNGAQFKTEASAATTAGKLLKVDYVVMGRVEKIAQGYALVTSLFDVKNSTTVRTSRSSFLSDSGCFVETAAEDNAKALAGVKQLIPSKVSIQQHEDRTFKIEGITEELILGDIKLGARVAYFQLLKKSSESFLGTINGLNEDQCSLPIKFFADWFFTPTWGIEITWDTIKARTGTQEGDSDGTFTLKGPIISLIGRYVNDSSWTPYGGIGLAFFWADFDYDPAWYWGFPSDQEWIDAGRPSEPHLGKIRTMDLNNPIGILLNAGCEYRISDRWSADLYLRWTDVDVKAEALIYVDEELWRTAGPAKIPMDNIAVGLGIRYSL